MCVYVITCTSLIHRSELSLLLLSAEHSMYSRHSIYCNLQHCCLRLRKYHLCSIISSALAKMLSVVEIFYLQVLVKKSSVLVKISYVLAIFSSVLAKKLSVVAIFYLQILVKKPSALVLFSSVVAKISSVVAKMSSVVAKMSSVVAKISSVVAKISSVVAKMSIFGCGG